MSNSRWRAGFAIVFSYFASGSIALAQGILYAPDQQPSAWNLNEKPASWDINLAAGAAMQPTFHGSDRYRVTPVPLVIIRWRDTVSLGVEGLSFYWHHNNFRIGGGVNYEGGRLDHEASGILSSGDNRLRGLGDVDTSVGLRGFVSCKLGPVYLDTSAIKYLGSQNKGVLVNFSASAPLAATKRLIIRPHIGATWADDNYMQTFFGVSPIQASRSIFPPFNASSGLEDVNGGLTVVYLLNKHWFWGADATATQYLDHAAQSPITLTNTNATVATVIGYHF
jgi:outer membrane protein